VAILKDGKEKTAAHWTILENGAQATETPELIRMSLDRLRKNREMVTLAHRGYESAKTIIVSYDDEKLEIDKPVDWPGSQGKILILFKDEKLIWNHVQVRILQTTAASIFTGFPTRLVRIQRRDNYRVDAPHGSTAMFVHKDIPHKGLEVVNISVTGVLIRGDRNLPIAKDDGLFDLTLFFPGVESGLIDGASIVIRQAKVVRTCRDDNKKYCYGVFFHFAAGEEKVLLQYVRQRERELLRRGLE